MSTHPVAATTGQGWGGARTSVASGSAHRDRARRPCAGVCVWGSAPGQGWGVGVGRKWARRPEQCLFPRHVHAAQEGGNGRPWQHWLRARHRSEHFTLSNPQIFTTFGVYTVVILILSGENGGTEKLKNLAGPHSQYTTELAPALPRAEPMLRAPSLYCLLGLTPARLRVRSRELIPAMNTRIVHGSPQAPAFSPR